MSEENFPELEPLRVLARLRAQEDGHARREIDAATQLAYYRLKQEGWSFSEIARTRLVPSAVSEAATIRLLVVGALWLASLLFAGRYLPIAPVLSFMVLSLAFAFAARADLRCWTHRMSQRGSELLGRIDAGEFDDHQSSAPLREGRAR